MPSTLLCRAISFRPIFIGLTAWCARH